MRGAVGFLASSGPKTGYKALVGTGSSTTSNTTCTITTAVAIEVGDLVVVRWAADNLSASTPTGAVTDSGGNTYTAHAFRGNTATAAGGIVGGIAATKATVAVPVGGTITLTLSGAVAQKAMMAHSYLGYDNTLRNAAVLNSGIGTAATVTSGSASTGDLVVGCMAIENNATPSAVDTDTTNGSWSANSLIISVSGGTATSRVEASGQHKIVTAAGAQTFNQTVANTDWAAMVCIFQKTP